MVAGILLPNYAFMIVYFIYLQSLWLLSFLLSSVHLSPANTGEQNSTELVHQNINDYKIKFDFYLINLFKTLYFYLFTYMTCEKSDV